MPITKTYELFKFDELSDRAKERARDWYRESDRYFFDAENFGKDVLTEHAEYHFRLRTSEPCNFSLNYCQGDGVSWNGVIDLDFLRENGDTSPEHLKQAADLAHIRCLLADLEALDYSVWAKIRRNEVRYSHEYTMALDVEVEGGPDYGDWSSLRKAFTESMRRVMPTSMRRALREYLDRKNADGILVVCGWFEEHTGVDVQLHRAILKGDAELGEQAAKQLEELLLEYVRDAARSAERAGYEELDCQASEEVVDENIRINEYTFDENGKRCN